MDHSHKIFLIFFLLNTLCQLGAVEDVNIESKNLIEKAVSYEKGKDIDLKKSFHYYMLAAKKEDREGMFKVGAFYFYGIGVDLDYNEAYKWLKKSSLKGDDRAFFLLGNMYLKGKGKSVDFSKAFNNYLNSANAFNLDAQLIVASFYTSGIGVEQNYMEAYKWLLIAKFSNANDTNQLLDELKIDMSIQDIELSTKKANEFILKRASRVVPIYSTE